MVIDNSFLKKHLVDLVHSGVSLEGALATRVQTKDIIVGRNVNITYKTAKIVKNLVMGFRYVYSGKASKFNSPETLSNLHFISSEEVEDYTNEPMYRGKFRDFPVKIGGTHYGPPVCPPRCFIS